MSVVMGDQCITRRRLWGREGRDVAAAGDLKTPTGLYPERCRVMQFPDREQRKALGILR
jgi:hypothetical protein